MFKRILVVVDPRPVARAAVTGGVALAKALDAEVLFASVTPNLMLAISDIPMPAGVPLQHLERESKKEVARLLAGARAVADRAGVTARSVALEATDEPARVIASAAGRRRCDLIVVASQGRNALLRLLTGSVIPGLITASAVPVLVCKQSNPREAPRPAGDAKRAATRGQKAPASMKRRKAA